MTARKALVMLSFLALGAGVFHYAMQLLQAFQFKVTGYGVPNFNSWILRVPITLQFDNPSHFTISADNVTIDLYLKTRGQFLHIGNISTPITLPPGKSKQTFIPVMDLTNVSTAIIDSWQQMVSNNRIDLRTDVRVTYKGVQLPMQQYEDNVMLV